MGWIITLGILVLLAILPLGASVKYDADGPLVRLIAGPVKITLFPRPKKPKKEKKPKEAKKEKKPKQTKEKSAAKQKPTEKKADKSNEWHTVKDGDLVGRIASEYGLTVADIKRLNPGIDVDRISIGQMIRIKGEPETTATTTATQTATQTASVEQKRVESEVWHTVVDGDLVGRIASQYGTTTSRIKELNPDLNPDRISIGQRIRVK